jgi:hypothetical protein
MINGVHVITYSKDAEADRAFLQRVFHLDGVDAGGGWLIFGLPPAELGIHPSESGGEGHELYFMTDDIKGLIKDLGAQGVGCGPLQDQRWGLLTTVVLPSRATLSVYEPRHPRPMPMATAKARPKQKAKTRPKATPVAKPSRKKASKSKSKRR